MSYEKVQCTCLDGYKDRKLTDPNCCAHSCDYNQVVDELNSSAKEVAFLCTMHVVAAIFYADNPIFVIFSPLVVAFLFCGSVISIGVFIFWAYDNVRQRSSDKKG